ncbi:MAG: hypothetical protein JWM28_3373 [Chitinophagaceae bacterium]|nr:hypothetical protein [Chitinophagaceae bacterium]
MPFFRPIASKYFTPAIHILVWALLFTTLTLLFHDIPNGTGLPGYFFLITNIYHVGLFYLNAFFLYPRLVNRRNWWLYIIAIDILMTLSYYGKIFFLKWQDPLFEVSDENKRIIFFPPFAFFVASFIFRLVANRIEADKNEKAKKAERLSSELKFLRSQVSPHFLFNMMTNMVALARQKSELLEPSLIKLSELLRYMLYDTNGEKFSVTSEIANLKNYIELQQLRFGDEANVKLEIHNEGPDRLIEPLLLIPFAENAFKHGLGLVKDPFIFIKLEVKDKQLQFCVRNNFSSRNSSKDKNSGIGLVNVKERLNLVYPEKSNLLINKENGIFEVKLKLDLS